jgi:hypothetical protein
VKWKKYGVQVRKMGNIFPGKKAFSAANAFAGVPYAAPEWHIHLK